MGLSWPQGAQTKAQVGEEEYLLQKEEVGESPAAKHPQKAFWGKTQIHRAIRWPLPSRRHVNPRRGSDCSWQGRYRERDHHSAKTELASPPTGSLPWPLPSGPTESFSYSLTIPRHSKTCLSVSSTKTKLHRLLGRAQETAFLTNTSPPPRCQVWADLKLHFENHLALEQPAQ